MDFKSNWKKPRSLGSMRFLNALAFAHLEMASVYFAVYGDESNTEQDLFRFYGRDSLSFLSTHRIQKTTSVKRNIYKQAILTIDEYLKNGEKAISLIREFGALSELLKIRHKSMGLQVIYEARDYFVTLFLLAKQGFRVIRHQLTGQLLIRKAEALNSHTEYQRILSQQKLMQLPGLAFPPGCLNFPEPRRIRWTFVYIGRLHSYEGSNFIFEIARVLKSKNISLCCYYGYEQQLDNVRLKAQQYGINNVLKFETCVSSTDLHRVLDNQVNIDFVPLQVTFYRRDLTCPVKAFNSLSQGLSIVASELSSLHEVLLDNRRSVYLATSQNRFQRNTKFHGL